MDHDISLSPEHEVEESCCTEHATDATKNKECFEIPLPPDDPFYSPLNQTCIHFTRSKPHCSSGWPLSTIREQQNVITSFLDASNVYGSLAERSSRVRAMVRGKLKVSREDDLLPEEDIQSCKVFIAGDVRAMENPNLASLHTLFVREHNRISDRLWYMTNWTKYGNENCEHDRCDELLYQNSRRILIAEWQNIIYSEWLPQILGHNRMHKFHLKINSNSVYNTSIDPSILVSFSTAAFRFGHSMIQGVFQKKNPISGEILKNVTLRNTFFNPNEYRGTGMETLLAGLENQRAQSRDRFVSRELTNFLFQTTEPNEKIRFGEDLIARNIARGRDHGIPSYAKFYERFGPKTDAKRFMKCWGDVPEAFDTSSWNLLKSIYIHPKDIDLFVGGLLEKKVTGHGVLGYTFGWIVAEQFRRLKQGDRFFFTHEGTLKIKAIF